MSRSLRVLLVESEEGARAMLHDLRQRGLEPSPCQRVDRLDALEGALRAHPWDLVLVDSETPGLDAGQAFALVRTRAPRAQAFLISSKLPFLLDWELLGNVEGAHMAGEPPEVAEKVYLRSD